MAVVRSNEELNKYAESKAPLTGTGASGTWEISINGNAATTTKLATARAINGVNFDGTADIVAPTNLTIGTITTTAVPIESSSGTNASIPAATTTLAGVMSAVDKTKLDGIAIGATANAGTVTSVATSGAITGGTITTTGTISHSTADGYLHVPATGTTNNGKVLTAGATAGSLSWTALPSAPVTSVAGKTGAVTLVKGDVGLGSVDNTADSAKNVLSATKLTTARTISLTGDVTGSVSFDGSANVSIATTVNDTSITVPAGTVIAFANSSVPTGFLECNGATISRSTYSALFAVIGTTYGAGNGSTTFAIPDLRGEFIRGWDHSRGVDSGRAIGSNQSDAYGSHTHSGSTNSAGAHTHNIGTGDSGQISVDGSSIMESTSGIAEWKTSRVSTEGTHSHTLTINASGSTETRPRNIAMMYCIKY